MGYHDYIIKNGKFIGKFNEMYKNIKDPWKYKKNKKNIHSWQYNNIYYFADYVKSELILNKKKLKTLEIGCGHSEISNTLYAKGYNAFGTDISEIIINKIT